MKSTEVCVDASLAIKVVVPEAGSDKADALFNEWAGAETRLIAPVFFEVETDSILRQKVPRIDDGRSSTCVCFSPGIANHDYTFSGTKRTYVERA